MAGTVGIMSFHVEFIGTSISAWGSHAEGGSHEDSSGNETCLPGLGGVVCPGFWLLATAGPPSPWFPGEIPPHPHCLPVHWRVVEQVLREAGTCIGSHPASQSKGQTEAGGRRSQIQPSLACLLSHGQPRCQVPEAQAARNMVSSVAEYGVGWHQTGTPCGPSSLQRASPARFTACTPGWPELSTGILTPARWTVPGSYSHPERLSLGKPTLTPDSRV